MAGTNFTIYDAKQCTVTVDDVFITGLGEDMVSGEKEEDLATAVVGAQGDTVRSVVNNTLGQLTITVQPTSPQKAFLMQTAQRADFFPVWVTNKSLGERFGGSKCALLTFPEMARGAEAEDMEFVFQVYDYTVESI